MLVVVQKEEPEIPGAHYIVKEEFSNSAIRTPDPRPWALLGLKGSTLKGRHCYNHDKHDNSDDLRPSPINPGLLNVLAITIRPSPTPKLRSNRSSVTRSFPLLSSLKPDRSHSQVSPTSDVSPPTPLATSQSTFVSDSDHLHCIVTFFVRYS